MSANWNGFIENFSDFLQSKKSKGPEEIGAKLAQLYLIAISSSQTPTMNFFQGSLAGPILTPGFIESFRRSSIEKGISFIEKEKDPRFQPSEDSEFPNIPTENLFEKEFKQYLRDKKIKKFVYFEVSSPNSEYVLETSTDAFVLSDLFRIRGNDDEDNPLIEARDTALDILSDSAFGKKIKSDIEKKSRLEKEREYEKEKEEYNKILIDYIENLQKESEEETRTGKSSNDDPYDDMAKVIVAFWSGSGPNVFSKFPPIPPSLEAIPGTFQIVFPGIPKIISDGIRRAFNIGIQPQFSPLNDPDGSKSSRAIAKALAVVFSKHLLSLKFIYFGSTSGVSSLGLVPFIF